MAAASTHRVMVVDDHPLFRAGLELVLRREPDLDVIASVGCGEQVRRVVADIAIDVVILDLIMPVCGLSLACELQSLQPSCRILVLSVIDAPCVVADVLRIGSAGYALKTQPVSEIIDAIRIVASGGLYLAPRISRDEVQHHLAAARRPRVLLTARERAVLDLVVHGLCDDAIARQLAIARRTVESHRLRLLQKLSPHAICEVQRLTAGQGRFHRA